MALGKLFAEAANALIEKSGIPRREIRAIGSHGQTIRHRPQAKHPFTLQLGNPSMIAEQTGLTTVADFRARDMASGGQGAPMVSGFHQLMFRSQHVDRVILNIGGIANITALPKDLAKPVLGFDTGPGNTLLDQWIHQHQNCAHDTAGHWAASGKVSTALLNSLLSDPYFKKPPPKSTGREDFNLEWLESHVNAQNKKMAAEDVQATLVQLTVRTIVQAIRDFLPQTQEVYVCGGGAHNNALMKQLAESLSGIPVSTTETLGMPPDWIEAAAFAWLAHQAMERQSGNVPSVTGAKRAVVLGGIFPGDHQG